MPLMGWRFSINLLTRVVLTLLSGGWPLLIHIAATVGSMILRSLGPEGGSRIHNQKVWLG